MLTAEIALLPDSVRVADLQKDHAPDSAVESNITLQCMPIQT